jgi:hypothetical protein
MPVDQGGGGIPPQSPPIPKMELSKIHQKWLTLNLFQTVFHTEFVLGISHHYH